MIQICRKDKEKGCEAIHTGKIDAAEMSFPNLIDDIILTLKKRRLTDLLAQAPCEIRFLSREITNCLKTVRGVDTYIPARENMIIYQDAVKLAVASGKWQKHPKRKRKEQESQLVKTWAHYEKAMSQQKMSPLMPLWCMIKKQTTILYL